VGVQGEEAVRRSFNPATLEGLRQMASEDVLALVAVHLKADLTYAPTKDPRTRRWHACTSQGEFEILTTGPKWWNTRAQKGGGGAIDLAMHVRGLSFVDAVKLLTALPGARGSDHP
jgi:hypothetical protein